MTSTPDSDPHFELAVEAVQFALPLYEMARMRSATCPRVHDASRFTSDVPDTTQRSANQWVHMRELLGPQHRRVVTPNNDTLYSNAWLDLSAGPIVIRAPAMQERYYVLGLLDMYTNPFGCIGTRTTGNDAGAFLLHGPGWCGVVPDGMRAIACPTNTIWIIGRILVDGEEDLAEALALQGQFAIEAAPGSAAQVPSKIDAGMQPNERPGDPERFVQVVNAMLAANPPSHAEVEWVARFDAVGIGAQCVGKTLVPATRLTLERAIAHVTKTLSGAPLLVLGGGWNLPVDVSASFGTDYRKRAQVALNYIGALGIEEAMYITADHDVDGAYLNGRFTYVIHFRPEQTPQVDAFWSLTAYERETCMLAENAIRRYSLGDRTRGLRHDADGGLRIAVSAWEPEDEILRANWLPAPSDRFYLALRLYVPRAAHLERQFVYPAVVRQAI
jgi:hypothetical protein